ncbi:LuxR C-terminal-related transcriptional regulator [Streptomyces puniciscabiei]
MLFIPASLRILENDQTELTEPGCRIGELVDRSRETWLSGDMGNALAAIDKARRTECSARCGCRILLTAWEVELSVMLRDLSRARAILDDTVLDGGEQTATVLQRTVSSLLRAHLAITLGDVEMAATLAQDALRTSEESGMRLWHPMGHVLLATAALRKVNISAAREYVTRLGEDALLGRSLYIPGQCAWVTALVYRAKGDVIGPLRLVAELVDLGPASRELLLSQPGAAPWLARFALGAGETGLAQRALRSATSLAARNPGFPTLAASAVHTRGLVESSLDLLLQAADIHRDPWAKASALDDVGTLLSADRAIAAYDRAATGYLVAGSTYDYLRMKSKIRDLGKAALPSPRGSEPPLAYTQLTRGEHEVAKLVAQGMTNVQVARVLSLSRHTVAFHLRKVFRKLGVSSRVELAHLWGTRTG